MIVITAGRTAPNKLVRFGGADTPLDDRGRRAVAALCASGVVVSGPVRCGPEASAVETVALLGGRPVVDDELRGLDVGRWDGRLPEEVPVDELGEWFAEPATAPHGGESVAAFVGRITGLLLEGPIVVVQSVAQALLCDGPTDFFVTEVIAARRYEAAR